MRSLPRIVNLLCHLHDAWIVGAINEPIRDYDIIVSFANWREAVVLVPMNAKPNSFGGWKFTDEEKTIDVWPGEMAWLMTNSAWSTAWHPKTNTTVRKVI